METKALAPSVRAGGIASNFSISGKEISTAALPVLRRSAISVGNRCRVCGPNTTSTYGARFTISPPSCEATQPPTPITRFGFFSFRWRTRPRSWNTFSCAFSRTEQVLNRITSASSGRSVLIMPSLSESTSTILSESYSFIWQPKVLMNTFLGPLGAVLSVVLGEIRSDAGCVMPEVS